jgi:hypothetical protein
METVGLNNSRKWNEIVSSMPEYDFYFLAAYQALEKTGTPLLLCSENVVLPVVLRKIPDTNYCDITSVYGYAGPLAKDLSPINIAAFQRELKTVFDEFRIVSAFSRLHPLFDFQENIFKNFGQIKENGTVVCIDLRLPENEQRRQYSHSLKNQLNRLRKSDRWTVRPYQNQADVEAFAAIYKNNMQRVNASKMYFFDKEYFSRFLETLPSNLYLACYDGRPVCGSLFTECRGIIQTHLSATCDEFLHLSPLKYVWDEIRNYGAANGFNYLHLGGGLGGGCDSLFEFKAQFSKIRLPFQTWRYVHNPPIYAELSRARFGNQPPECDYFPIYNYDFQSQ